MKGVSTIVATILIVMITVALGGAAYLYLSGILTGKISTAFSIIYSYNDSVIIRNDGTDPINSVTATVDGNSANIVVIPNTNGLVGYWSFNEGFSNSASDSSDNGNTGTLTNFIQSSSDDPTSAMLSQSGLISFNAANCVDDNTGTNAWHTDSSTAGAWLKMDLGFGNKKDYVKTRIYAASSGYAGSYNILYSDDDSTYLTAATGFVPSAAGWNEKTWSSVGAHRYWRFNLTNTPGLGSWLNEFEMYKQGGWNSTDCKFGSCLGFDGSDDYVNISTINSVPSGSNNRTITAWIKPNTSTGRGMIVSYGDNSNNQKWDFEINGWASALNGKLIVHLWNAGIATVDNVVTPNQWMFVAVIYSGGSLQNGVNFYVNGIQKTTQNADQGTTNDWAQTPNTVLSNLRIGIRSGDNAGPFNGTIDDVAIWNRALSADEISSLYAGSIPARQTAKIKFLTPLSSGMHTIRLCISSTSSGMCSIGYLTIT